MPFGNEVATPERIATAAFTDAAAAVARLEEIYERNTAFLRREFEAYLQGRPPKARVRANYPFVRIATGTYARLDSRVAYGFVTGPGARRAARALHARGGSPWPDIRGCSCLRSPLDSRRRPGLGPSRSVRLVVPSS